jgi:ABC-type multidrug transport system fused ATPase/permease subunit
MQEGEIIESGNHEELMSYASKYATMWNLQQNEIETPVLENTNIKI